MPPPSPSRRAASLRSRTQAGYLELILLGVLWGSVGVLVKHVRVGSSVIAGTRAFLGFLAVLAVEGARGRLGRMRLRERRWLLIADGVVLGIHWVCMFEAFKRLSVATAILLVFVGPVLVAALVGPVLKERVERRTVAALAVSVIGMVMIAAPAWKIQDPAGVVYALVSAVGFATMLLLGKQLTEVYEPQAILAWQLGVGALVVAPFALTSNLHGLGAAMPALTVLSLLHTAVAGFVYFYALGHVKAQHAGVLTYLEPATAIVYAWVFLGERPPPVTIAGGLLIMVAGLMIVTGRRGAVLAASVPGTPQEPVGTTTQIKASLEP